MSPYRPSSETTVTLTVDAQYYEFLPLSLRLAAQHLGQHANPNEHAAVMDLAEQIEAQLPKPRIEEPGLYGVVMAKTDGTPRGAIFIRRSGGWENAGDYFPWNALRNPELVREGLPE